MSWFGKKSSDSSSEAEALTVLHQRVEADLEHDYEIARQLLRQVRADAMAAAEVARDKADVFTAHANVLTEKYAGLIG
jgi:hypothetical protein